MASDMRLNDKPIAKDGAYIYAEAADGSQVKISKADLASVVAGKIRNSYIPYDSLNNFIKVVLNSVADKETGIHIVPSGGPVYHVVMLRYNSDFYSAILSTYDLTEAMPLYVRYTNGDYKIQYL